MRLRENTVFHLRLRPGGGGDQLCCRSSDGSFQHPRFDKKLEIAKRGGVENVKINITQQGQNLTNKEGIDEKADYFKFY